MGNTMPDEGTDAAETAPVDETPKTDTDETPKEVDWKSRSREWEKRAKANADAAAQLAKLEDSQKTETERLAGRLEEAEKAATTARAEALRWKIAAAHGLNDEDAELFLTGTDEETLTKQAERLAARNAEEGKPRTPKPDPNQGRASNGALSTGEQFAATVGGFLN